MSKNQEPVVLELAPLPREQIGPFIILGVDKDAGKEEIVANWAKRVIWARRGQIRIPLEDVNWARDALDDREKRLRADAASLNADTADGVLRRLSERYGGQGTPGWQPLDLEKPLQDYTPALDLPDIEAVRAAVVVPDLPEEFPAAAALLEETAALTLDPWALTLPE